MLSSLSASLCWVEQECDSPTRFLQSRLVSGIFWLNYCTVGLCGDTSPIFTYVKGSSIVPVPVSLFIPFPTTLYFFLTCKIRIIVTINIKFACSNLYLMFVKWKCCNTLKFATAKLDNSITTAVLVHSIWWYSNALGGSLGGLPFFIFERLLMVPSYR